MKKHSDMISFIVIGVVFVLLIGMNWGNYANIAQTVIWKLQGNTDVKAKENISSALKESFKFRDKFIDLYGVTKKALGENIIGEYEYVKDEMGVMQHILGTQPADQSNYIESVKNLLALLNERNIPCIDVNLPDRGQSFLAADKLEYSCKRNREIEDKIISFGVDEFNVQKRLVDAGIISQKDFFFHTDIHLTSKAEFLMAKYLTEYLTEKYFISFPNSDIVYDFNMYDWQDHDFCGNFCGSTGKKYIELDNFQTFVPQYETNMKLTLPDGNIRQGDFINVMTNQYTDEGSYWVLNYGQWSKLYYTYENLKYPNAPKLLVVAD